MSSDAFPLPPELPSELAALAVAGREAGVVTLDQVFEVMPPHVEPTAEVIDAVRATIESHGVALDEHKAM